MIRLVRGSVVLSVLSVLSVIGLWAAPAAAQLMSADERDCLQLSRAMSCRFAGTGYVAGLRGYPRDAIRGMQLLDRGCTLGDGEACQRFGFELSSGSVVARDTARAADAYRRGCALRNALSCERAAQEFESLGNALEAVRNYEIACDLRRAWACKTLARKYETGRGGVTLDAARAASYAQRACAYADTTIARNALCGASGSSLPVAASPTTMSPEVATEACKTGDLEKCYLAGLQAVLARDYANASARFEAGCERKHGKSCDRLARMYVLAEGRAADPAKASAYFEQACDAGYASGCTSRGKQQADAERKSATVEDAFARWWVKGCAGGDSLGCSYLAGSYELARLSKPLDAEARALLEKACKPLGNYSEHAPCRAIEARAAAAGKADKCKKGDAAACVDAAQNLRDGVGVPKDPKAALELLTVGCNELRDATSCADAAALQRSGELGKADAKAATALTQKALSLAEPRCSSGESAACALLARFALSGDGGKRDPKRARDLYLKLCQKGQHCVALYRAYLLSSADPEADKAVEEALSKSCTASRGGVECGGAAVRKSLAEHQAKCARGQLDGCVEQARLLRGAGLAAMAVPLYERACGKGVLAACAALVELHGGWDAEGVTASAEKQKRSLATLVGACEKNDATACAIESELRRYGKGIPKDDAAAARLRGRATALLDEECGRGNGVSCRRAAVAHRNGEGAPKSVVRARELFERGCELKDPDSCASAGYAYFRGESGAAADLGKAAGFYLRGCGLDSIASCEWLFDTLPRREGVDAEVQRQAKEAVERACKRGMKSVCPEPSEPATTEAPKAPQPAPPPPADDGE